MKQQYRGRKGQKAVKSQNQKQTRPFEGLVNQLNKERLVLVNLNQSGRFIDECHERGISVGVGSKYGDGIIVYKK